MSKAPALFLACAAALLSPQSARAEPAVLGLARAYLGPQSTLDGINSIHFVGTLERVDPNQPAKATAPVTLDMIFSKPLRQRLVIRGPKVTMTTVLDGYDAWDSFQDNLDPTRHRLNWLKAADVKNLRANTWENLYYYQVPDGGSVEDKGPAKIDGADCELVDFTHGGGIVYERYFDRDTGRLVLTVNGPESIRESGEMKVDGIRFPKVIVSTTRTESGKDLVATATFNHIDINEPLTENLFVVPNFPPPKPAAQPASDSQGVKSILPAASPQGI
jgi:hypothetical protein